MKLYGVLSLLVLLNGVALGEDPAAATFPGFCEEWMHKLEAREQYNVTHIKWESNPDGVQGAYVGYTHEHTCTLKDGSGHVPVGEIVYREIRYEKRGSTITEAEHSEPRQGEITEVTEIFRCANGKWVY
jgi:hypothetical protein